MGLAQVVIVADDFTNLKPDVMATHAKIEPLLTQCRRWWLQNGTNYKNQATKMAGETTQYAPPPPFQGREPNSLTCRVTI